MLPALEVVTKGFVSSFEEEEYELTKIFYNEPDLDTDDEDEERYRQNPESNPDNEREILDDDSAVIRELF